MSSSMLDFNNPLNIRYNASNQWRGLTGKTSKGFCCFEDLDFCLRAGLILLCKSYRKRGIFTIKGIISRFAPSSENDTESYIRFVSDRTKFHPSEGLDILYDYCKLLSAMCWFESKSDISPVYIYKVARQFKIKLFKMV